MKRTNVYRLNLKICSGSSAITSHIDHTHHFINFSCNKRINQVSERDVSLDLDCPLYRKPWTRGGLHMPQAGPRHSNLHRPGQTCTTLRSRTLVLMGDSRSDFVSRLSAEALGPCVHTEEVLDEQLGCLRYDLVADWALVALDRLGRKR